MPDWRKGFIFLLFLSLYLFSSYLILIISLSGFMSISGICSYGYSDIWKSIVHENICPNSTTVDQRYQDYMTSVGKFQNFRNDYVKSLEPFLMILNPILGAQIGELLNLKNILVISVYWYLLSSLIVWIYDKVKKKKK